MATRGRPSKKLEKVHNISSNDGKTTMNHYDWEIDTPSNKWDMICESEEETIKYYFDKNISKSGPYRVEIEYKNSPKPKVKQKRGRPSKKDLAS